MKQDDLPPRWKAKLAEWIEKHGDARRGRLGAGNFPTSNTLQITFEDQSKVCFRYALTIEAPDLNEIGVFTEHCGYHIFPLYGTTVTRVELKW